MYRKFSLMLIISFFIMYGVMFLNVDNAEHVYLSMTRLYMSLLMVSPMAIVMLLLMQKMYQNKRLNALIITCSLSVFILSLTFLRTQTFVSDVQYLKAMIPYHSSAVMTSRNAHIDDPDVKKLSESIIGSQEREIKEMKEMLGRLENK